jgi:SAM-dependent methyltransferase
MSDAGAEVADAENLPFNADEFDVGVSGLVLNFAPHPDRGLAEIARVVRDGGCIAAYVWDYAGRMQLIRHFWDAAVELDPQAEPPTKEGGFQSPTRLVSPSSFSVQAWSTSNRVSWLSRRSSGIRRLLASVSLRGGTGSRLRDVALGGTTR